MPIDPVCKMQVDIIEGAITASRDGQSYYFCSEYCRKKFLARSNNIPSVSVKEVVQGAVYTCPMHLEIKADKSGDCLKCGMPLETLTVSVENEVGAKEIADLTVKFWTGLILASPVLYFALGEMFPVLQVSLLSRTAFDWTQLILSTLVIFWIIAVLISQKPVHTEQLSLVYVHEKDR